jgi:hypothetical protein
MGVDDKTQGAAPRDADPPALAAISAVSEPATDSLEQPTAPLDTAGASPPAQSPKVERAPWLSPRAVEELVIYVSLAALCVLYRVLALRPIEIWGDAGQMWHFSRQLGYENDFSHAKWTHQMARLGVNIPAYLIQRIVGTSSTAYFVAPVAAMTTQVLLVYTVARRLSGRAAGLIGALFLIYFAGSDRGASQLLPDVFEAVAAMVVAYFLIRFYEEEGRKRLYFLIAVGLGFVWEYMIKESSVMMFPGIVAAVFARKRRFKEVFILGAIAAGYVALETAGFSLVTQYAHRMAIVQSAHGTYPPITFWQLFDRFSELEPAWQMLFWMWVPTVFWHLGNPDKRFLPIVLMPVGFMFFLTFLVKGINPIQQWTAFKSRYVVIAGPLFVLGVSLLISQAGQRIWQLYSRPRWQAFPAQLAERGAWWIAALCLLLASFTYRMQKGTPPSRTLADTRHKAAILNDAFRRNLPIIEEEVPFNDGVRYARALSTAYAVYFNDKYLSQSTLAKPGWLPNITEGVRISKGKKPFGYILRDEKAYENDELKELIESGCALVLVAKTRKNTIEVSPSAKLPKHCKAPRGTELPR